MHLLKEPITSITYSLDFTSSYERMLVKLKEMNLLIKSENKQRGEIVVCCLPKLVNMLLWRCWIDKLLFEVKQLEKNTTKVDIFGLPNLFRLKVKEKENLMDINEILAQLKMDSSDANK